MCVCLLLYVYNNILYIKSCTYKAFLICALTVNCLLHNSNSPSGCHSSGAVHTSLSCHNKQTPGLALFLQLHVATSGGYPNYL